MKKSQHVVPKPDDGWAVRKSEAGRASKVFSGQEEAVCYAREAAQRQGGELYLHRADGTIRGRSSFGEHPQKPRG